MQRIVLLAALLALLGLSSAFAASFTVQTEDIASFTTDVSISVPTAPVVAYYLGAGTSILPGVLSPDPEPDNSVNSKAIDPGTGAVADQTDVRKYHSWQTAPLPPGGLPLDGPAVLRIFQNGSVDVATAGLFVCALPTTPTPDCSQLAGDSSSSGTESAGTEVPISFGNISTTVPEGSVLRLQIVNLTAKKWNVQWGYKSNRESRLDLSVVTP